MTLSEKMALDALADLDFGADNRKRFANDIGFILTVARDNDNWDLVNDLLDIAFRYMRGK